MIPVPISSGYSLRQFLPQRGNMLARVSSYIYANTRTLIMTLFRQIFGKITVLFFLQLMRLVLYISISGFYSSFRKPSLLYPRMFYCYSKSEAIESVISPPSSCTLSFQSAASISNTASDGIFLPWLDPCRSGVGLMCLWTRRTCLSSTVRNIWYTPTHGTP